MDLLRTVSPVVEQFSIDEAWVDMTGTERLYGLAHAGGAVAGRPDQAGAGLHGEHRRLLQ